MDAEILSELGLSKNEVSAYIGLVELGPSTAINVAKAAKLHKSNAYNALDSLYERGLVSLCVKDGTKYFDISNPNLLMSFLKNKEITLSKLIIDISVLQNIKKADGPAKKAGSVFVYEGVSATRQLMSDIIENSREFFALGIPKDFANIVGEGWLREWHTKRVKKKVWFHHILNDDYYLHRIKLLRSLKYTTVKFLSKENNSPIVVLVDHRGIVLVLLQPYLSIRIDSEDAARSFKQYYKMLARIAFDRSPQEMP